MKMPNIASKIENLTQLQKNKRLVRASESGNIELVKILLNYKSDVNYENGLALNMAVTGGHIEIVKLLFPKLSKRVKVDKGPFLSRASSLGHFEITKFLIQQNVCPKWRDSISLTYAAEGGYIDIVELLLDHGADIHASNDYALRSAVAYGHLDVVLFLISRGASVLGNDNSALIQSVEQGNIEMAKILLDHGADIHASNDSALKKALHNGHTKMIDFLISRGADISIIDQKPTPKLTKADRKILSESLGMYLCEKFTKNDEHGKLLPTLNMLMFKQIDEGENSAWNWVIELALTTDENDISLIEASIHEWVLSAPFAVCKQMNPHIIFHKTAFQRLCMNALRGVSNHSIDVSMWGALVGSWDETFIFHPEPIAVLYEDSNGGVAGFWGINPYIYSQIERILKMLKDKKFISEFLSNFTTQKNKYVIGETCFGIVRPTAIKGKNLDEIVRLIPESKAGYKSIIVYHEKNGWGYSRSSGKQPNDCFCTVSPSTPKHQIQTKEH